MVRSLVESLGGWCLNLNPGSSVILRDLCVSPRHAENSSRLGHYFPRELSLLK